MTTIVWFRQDLRVDDHPALLDAAGRGAVVPVYIHAPGDEGAWPVGEAAAWWHSWYDLTSLHGEPTLLTFAAGPCAIETRDWSDEAIVESVLASLREIYGDAVPTPGASRITRWQDDPYARGSYAYMTVGSETSDHDLRDAHRRRAAPRRRGNLDG